MQKLNDVTYKSFHYCTYNMPLPASTCKIIVENHVFQSSNAINTFHNLYYLTLLLL